MNQPGKIKIRRTTLADGPDLVELFSYPEVIREMLQLPYPTLELWQERASKLPADDYSLVAVLDNKVVGMAGLHKAGSSPRRQHARTIGMAVHPQWQGQGVGHALLTAIIDLAENWLNVVRLELTVYVDNHRAKGLYEKFGFVEEGRHQTFAFRDGEWVDAYTMARITSR